MSEMAEAIRQLIQEKGYSEDSVKTIIDGVPTNGNLVPAAPKNKDSAGKKKPAKKAGGDT